MKALCKGKRKFPQAFQDVNAVWKRQMLWIKFCSLVLHRWKYFFESIQLNSTLKHKYHQEQEVFELNLLCKDINGFEQSLPRGVGSLKKKMWYELLEVDYSHENVFVGVVLC